jgi:hypothetical protein
VYQYEIDPELPDDEDAYWKIPDASVNTEKKSETTVTVRYHYREDADQ